MRKFALLLLLGFILPAQAFSQGKSSGGGSGRSRGSIGLLGGLAFPTTSSPVLAYGILGHYRVWSGIGVGPFFQRFGVSASMTADATTSTTVQTSATYIGVQGIFAFAGTLDGFQAGLRTGVAIVGRFAETIVNGTSVLAVNDSVGAFFSSLHVAYDYKFSWFSLGAELQGFVTVGASAPLGVMLYFAPKFWF